MLFKRYLFLAACILVFIFGFIGYFTFARAQVESRFREERVKYNVEGLVLTSTNAPAATPLPTPPVTAGPTTSAPMPPDAPSAPAPATNAPAGDTPPADPNIIIGPVPPPSTDAPTNPPAPAPAPSDSGSAPMAPSSTMNDSRQAISSYLVRAAYKPGLGLTTQAPTLETVKPPVLTPLIPVPTATNSGTGTTDGANGTPLEMTNTGTATAISTNAATATVSGTNVNSGRPMAVEPSVIVLLYHQFIPSGAHVASKFQWTMNVDVFESEMKYIHDNGYHVIPMSDLIKYLHHEIGLPPNSVVITIDDGYKSAIVHAAPILKKYGYPWTFFVYPEFITVNEGTGAASWNDLLALQAEGVDIESHSMTHPILTKHTQKWKGSTHLLSAEEYDEWLTNETLGSKTLLEQKMGKPILSLAYPYGAYNKEVEAKAIAAGYQYIFTVADNPVRNNTDPHSIGRYTMTQGVEKNFASYLRQGALGIAEADPAPGGTTSNPRPVITAVLGYAGNLDPTSMETTVRDFGVVKHDYDPATSTIRLYLPRDLVQAVNLVNIRVKDSQTGQFMVANWHFNYVPATGAATTHAPIAPATNAPAATTNAPTSAPEPSPAASTNSATTNAPAAVRNEPPMLPLKSVNGASSASSKAH